MPSLTIRFDANKLKNDVYAITKRKVGAVVSNDSLYKSLAEEFLAGLRDTDIIPKDTGAMRYGIVTTKGRGAVREGTTYIRKTEGHDYGVIMSAVQHYTPVTDRGKPHKYSYGAKATENNLRTLGFSSVSEAFKASPKWSEFVETAATLVQPILKES